MVPTCRATVESIEKLRTLRAFTAEAQRTSREPQRSPRRSDTPGDCVVRTGVVVVSRTVSLANKQSSRVRRQIFDRERATMSAQRLTAPEITNVTRL